MKKKLTQLRWLVTMLLFVTAIAMPKMAWAEITPTKPSGDGTSAKPYQIGTAEELYWFAALVNGDTSVDEVAAADKAACAKLTTNITVNSGVLKSDGSLADEANCFTAWTPISADDENPYTGTFNGNGYTISGLYFNDTSVYFIGLFGVVGSGSKICNVGIVDSYFNGYWGIGGVCGYCLGGEITNCYNTGTVIGTSANIGGVCGYSSGTITDCYNTGNVSGTSTNHQEGCVGGVCGINIGESNMSTITRSYNSGKVSGGYIVGGVCGANGWGYDAQIINCYNTGEVTGTKDDVGGICGYNDSHIEKCYNSAAVSGGSYVGSVCGFNRSVITTCYYLSGIATGGINNSDVSGSAESKTAEQFASGEVCYQLNALKNVNVWRQNIGTDNFPVLEESHGIVYASSPCPVNYSNTQSDVSSTTEHNYVDGVCTICDAVKNEPEMIGDVYQLKTKENLYWFAEQVNSGKYYLKAVLANDITVNTGSLSATTTEAKKWTPIGNSLAHYRGIFNGQGHTISGLYINDTSGDSGGLFGYLESGGEISNVGVVNSYFSIRNVGGVCANNNGKISNCYALGELHGDYSGGVCWYNEGIISNCYASCTISGLQCSGISCRNYGEITNCYFDNEKFSGEPIYYNADGSNYTKVEGKSKAVFKSGEVAYLLNESKSDGTQKWFQNLSEEDGDAYPMLKGTETNTVYRGYWHGETSTSYCNRCHEHAYDSCASNEQNGNHDKSYQGVFTWADNEDKTNATVTATFTCSVCGKVETPELTAVHDESNTNTVANCTEDGYNFYKTSYAFAGETFTHSYKQKLPALGHNMNEITFDKNEKIYSNQCQRKGCGHIGCYATSDGNVEAHWEGGTYKVASFNVADATAYNSEADFTATSLAYRRTFYDDKWMAVYVPFAIDCSKLESDYEMATINNFHEYEQEDGTYKVVLEVKRVTKGGTIPALTPCLMRMKTTPESEVEKTLNFDNAEFSAAADKSIDCSSVTRYYQFTGSLNGKTGLNEDTDFVLNEGKLYKTSESTVLLPQRWYLSATDRTSSSVEPVTMLCSISINVIGDGEATGIEDIQVNTELGADAFGGIGIYDLQGRKINSEPTKGMYIKNGKKYIK